MGIFKLNSKTRAGSRRRRLFAATVATALCSIIPQASQAATLTVNPIFTSNSAGSVSKSVSVKADNLSLGWTGSTAGSFSTYTRPALTSFAKFDSALGTLIGATLHWSTSASLSRSWSNITCDDGGIFDPSCVKVTLSAGGASGSLSLDIAGGLLASGTSDTERMASFSLASINGKLEPDDDETNLGSVPVDSSTTGGYVSGRYTGFDLAALTGSGERTDRFSIGSRIFLSYGDTDINCDASASAPRDTCSADLNLRIGSFSRFQMVYTYEALPPDPSPVPLPAGLPLLLAGLGGLAAVRKRSHG